GVGLSGGGVGVGVVEQDPVGERVRDRQVGQVGGAVVGRHQVEGGQLAGLHGGVLGRLVDVELRCAGDEDQVVGDLVDQRRIGGVGVQPGGVGPGGRVEELGAA